jgi:hypothetical protein
MKQRMRPPNKVCQVVVEHVVEDALGPADVAMAYQLVERASVAGGAVGPQRIEQLAAAAINGPAGPGEAFRWG